MKTRFRFQMTITMIVFAMAVSITIATTNHLRLRDQAINANLDRVMQNEETVKYALDTTEKAFYVFGENIAPKMKENSLIVLDMYDKNPNFETWDFANLKSRFSMDIYIINSEDVVIYSSYGNDIGLDFRSCCGKLARILDERRILGAFFHDGIDLEQQTGMIKKYSYMATRDKKYLVQLGFSLQNGNIFKQFNFFNTIDDLVKQNPSINEINVLNVGGNYLGKSTIDHKLPEERKSAFERTLTSEEATEIEGSWRGEPAVYRYVHYKSNYDKGATREKVLEIVYNEKLLQTVLYANKRTFVIQLFVVLLVTIGLALLISRWVAKPMHLAFHDSLTGLNNRAAFDELLASALYGNKGTTALLMIDLDNFKMVNDSLGHDKGDYLLKEVARSLRSLARKGDSAIRLGGDEFVMIMPSASKQESERMAAQIIETIENTIVLEIEMPQDAITVSIGIALAPEHGSDPETLSKMADLALYASKENGKNQFRVYDGKTPGNP